MVITCSYGNARTPFIRAPRTAVAFRPHRPAIAPEPTGAYQANPASRGKLGLFSFRRGRHGTKLTSAGEQFLEEARPIVNGFDRLVEGGRRLARGESGRLRIGFGFHTFELVPRLIGRLRQIAPGVEISLRDMSTLEQTEALRSGRIDAGFVRSPVSKEFEATPVIRDRLALVSSRDSRLPENATLKDCAQEPFILISNERAPTFRRHASRFARNSVFIPESSRIPVR